MINYLTTAPPALLHLELLASPSVKSPLLRVGLHFLPRATLIVNFLRRRSPGPPLRPAVATRGSGGLLDE